MLRVFREKYKEYSYFPKILIILLLIRHLYYILLLRAIRVMEKIKKALFPRSSEPSLLKEKIND